MASQDVLMFSLNKHNSVDYQGARDWSWSHLMIQSAFGPRPKTKECQTLGAAINSAFLCLLLRENFSVSLVRWNRKGDMTSARHWQTCRICMELQNDCLTKSDDFHELQLMWPIKTSLLCVFKSTISFHLVDYFVCERLELRAGNVNLILQQKQKFFSLNCWNIFFNTIIFNGFAQAQLLGGRKETLMITHAKNQMHSSLPLCCAVVLAATVRKCICHQNQAMFLK